MISQDKIDHVERLLKDPRNTQRKISKITGVSRGMISLIANGQRKTYEAKQESHEFASSDVTVKCPTCGHRVKLPCLLCWLHANPDAEASDEYTSKPKPGRWLGTELQGDELKRYLEIKAEVERKVAAGIRTCAGHVNVTPRYKSG